jgi:5-methylcytosine-specific restriction protein A
VLNPDRPFDRVFIFRRGEDAASLNQVFSGRCERVEGPEGRRYRLHLRDVRLEGTTRTSWRRFASAGQNPIRYLSSDDEADTRRSVTKAWGRPLTATRVLRLFDAFQFDHDDREPPDSRRRGKFREGWADTAVRHEVYSEGTLCRLTWQNLGYRFGDVLGPRAPEVIDSVYDHLVRHFEVVRPDGLVALPGEVVDGQELREGAVCQVTVNAYERNREARRRCIEHHGNRCKVCGMSFGERYGEVAEGFIHVHHGRPVSEAGGERVVDPVTDLVPVCPNCHAVMHRRDPPYGVEEVRGFLQRPGEP